MLSTQDYDLITIQAIEDEIKDITSRDLSFYDMSDDELLDLIIRIANLYELMSEIQARYA